MTSDPDKKVAVLFNCLDWRLHPQVEDFFKKEIGDYDLFCVAGSIKGLLEEKSQAFYLSQIDTSIRLHNCQKVVLTMHLDCGAYGGSKSFENSESEKNHHLSVLDEAENLVKAKYPALEVEKYLINLDPAQDGWMALPRKI